MFQLLGIFGKEAYRCIEYAGNFLQSTGANAIGAFFVLLNLLESDAQRFS
jgi:hypothetical protein